MRAIREDAERRYEHANRCRSASSHQNTRLIRHVGWQRAHRAVDASLAQVRSAADVSGVMRRNGASIALLLCASGLLFAGCGGSASTTRTLGADASMSAQAAASANAINLRQSDVPGMTAQFEHDREARSGPLGNCDQAAARAPLGFLSQRFGRGGTRVLPSESVSSGVYLMASGAQAVREFAALGSDRARACIRHDVERTISKGERERAEPFLAAPVEVVSLAPLVRPLPVAGMRRIVHLSQASRFTEGRSTIYLDQGGFVVGRVLVELLTVGSPRPLPLATERRLLVLLHTRAKAHKLA